MSKYNELENVLIANYAVLYERFYAPNNIIVFPAHWHKRTEMLHIIKGCLEVTIGDEVLFLKANDFCYIRSTLPHKGISRNNDLEYEMVQFRENEHQQVLSSNKELLPFLDNKIEIVKQFKDDDIARLFHHIAEYYKFRSAFQNTLFLGIIYEIYGHLAIKHSISSKLEIYTSDNFSKAVRYIDLNYAHGISVAELAEKFSFEPTYFSRIFKKKMGVSATNYITCLKLEDAENLLATTDLSTEIISQKCGFSSASYFIKCFKKRYNIKPMQYRKSSRFHAN